MRRRDLPILPIDDVLPRLRDALRGGTSAVLVAPPGAGKTTRVPLALLGDGWLGATKIVMLEPRRLAARAAAQHMAHLLDERIGETVGYRVRLDSQVGPNTRIEVVTEGVLTRMLASDPTLDNIGLVIFDEFHERSIHADVGLALTLRAREVLREDLRVLVMSATLDGAAVAHLLGNAAVISAEGKTFPVETRYSPARNAAGLEPALLATIERALQAHEGDMLAFLPGAREIRRTADSLRARTLPVGTYVVPLYGAMPLEEQDRAIKPSVHGERKVVLATTIAQTSLTIDGVRVVIDSGLTRVPRYSPRTGMTRLETMRVSRSAADQRRGRAGRTAPGVCYRLWDPAEDEMLRPQDIPEILQTDLAPLALELAAAGVDDPAALRWLDPPPVGAFAQARELLHELGALDASGQLTPHGTQLVALGMHPRLAHMLVHGRSAGHGALACDLAAILEERDILRGAPHERDPDVHSRIDALRGRRMSSAVDQGSLHRAREAARRWRQRVGVQSESDDAEAAGWLLALAYPDRIAQRRAGTSARYVLRNGAGAQLAAGMSLHNEPYLVVAELDGRRPESLILLAAPLALDEIERHFADQIETHNVIEWDETVGAVAARRTRRLGTIALSDDPLAIPDPVQIERVVREAIVAGDFAVLNWSSEAAALRARIAFLNAHDRSWPDVSAPALAATVERWLVPYLSGKRRREEIARIPVAEALMQLLTWEQRARLDALAPSHFVTPTGKRARIDYSDPTAPVLAVRLQELFGLTTTPRVLLGSVPLTLHLLSPSQRPVQVTQDLESFWKTAYAEVRRELRARYPKHRWPENPTKGN